ncbi:MAG TPA: sigma 54-interacting transcriptional regulator, partial [Flavobacterium sp.]|nr:sigma 54-interacting transcriptional regulator [Flavobacterium sp.]
MKNLYITWHYTTHGAAYLKHVLSKFYLSGLPEKDIGFDKLEQEALNTVFDEPKNDGFVFDEIIYLTASQQAFDNLSSRRFSYKKTILEDELVKQLGLVDVFEKIINDESICYNLEAEWAFVKKKSPKKLKDFEQVIWRNIQHYSVKEQLKWLTEHSNFKNVYSDKFKVVELNVTDLRNEKMISEEVSRWAMKYFSKKDVNPIINVSLGSNETQVVWHILSDAEQLPGKTRFIKTYDDKSDEPTKRFKRFSIQEIPTKLISEIGSAFKIYSTTKSPSRQLVNKKMEVFLSSGFSILLIGERGIGKSQIASEAKEKLKDFKGSFVAANCASFDEDNKAESELFGYDKGAFTGANTEKKGLLEEANNGILFLDEIHHLSKLVQAKLMKSLQTDKNNKMSIRRMGSNEETKIECRLIFATNKSITKLRDDLLPDFYDRIVQHVVHIPSLRETVEDRLQDWENVWNGLYGKLGIKPPTDLDLTNWLKKLPLYGNFRDLQKIAMYYNAFNSFDEEMQYQLRKANAFQYA